MPRAAARAMMMGARRFTSSARSICSGSKSSRGPLEGNAALATRMSMGPASSTHRATAARSLKSARITPAPSASASGRSASARRPLSTTVAPAACRARAMAAPMPPLAPVTSARVPVTCMPVASGNGAGRFADPGHDRGENRRRGLIVVDVQRAAVADAELGPDAAEPQARAIEGLAQATELDGDHDGPELLDDVGAADASRRARRGRSLRIGEHPAMLQPGVDLVDVLGVDLALDLLIAFLPRALHADRAVVGHEPRQPAARLHRL